MVTILKVHSPKLWRLYQIEKSGVLKEGEKLQSIIGKIKKQEALYFISYGLCVFTSILYLTFYYPYFIGLPHRIASVIFVLLAVCQELINSKWNYRSLIGLGVCAVAFLYMQRTSSSMGQSIMACTVLYIYCGRNIPFHKIAKFTLLVSGATLILVILSSLIGIIPNYVISSGGRTREYLGFRYALYPASVLFNMTCLYVYVRKKKITLMECIILLAVNFGMYYKTDSRTTFMLAIVVLMGALVLKYAPSILEKLVWPLIFSFVICGVISLGLTLGYNDSVPWMNSLNQALSNRISLGQNSLNEYGVSMFGEEIYWVGNGLNEKGEESTKTYTWVDCCYIQILQIYGVAFFAVFLFITVIAMYEFYKAKAYHLMIIMTCIALRCVIDDLSQYFYLNTFWIAVGIVFYRWSKRRIKKLKKRYLPRLEGLLKGQTH